MSFAWISHIPFEQASGKLKRLYDRIRTPDGRVDNIMKVHSLRPHTLEGHMALYKNVLHHSSNTLPKWFLETTGVYVSMLNNCEYCIEHHFAGLKRLLNNDERSAEIRAALESQKPENAFEGREFAALNYAAALTLSHQTLDKGLVDAMREAGMDDGEILEINQVVSYFAYANRTILGLGVSLQGDTLGLSPNNSVDPDNWQHQ